ncbi:MAG: hypothetical protein PUC15_00585 [Lentisphaeria bacterium]|nr:hypothetical protein [Lentisphaeria bacterium]
MTKHEPAMTRREFIAWGARFLLLGGLAALVTRHGSERRKTQDVCTDPKGYCRTCSALDYCGHPTARSFKAAVKREESRS